LRERWIEAGRPTSNHVGNPIAQASRKVLPCKRPRQVLIHRARPDPNRRDGRRRLREIIAPAVMKAGRFVYPAEGWELMATRFAIWIAVSTGPQATGDKFSLPEQEKQCRAAGLAKGWRDTRKVYSAPGESRTRWVNLRDAEAEIPGLHDMLEDAKARLFDVLICYDYNRFRDLVDLVAKVLGSYGAQLYSVNQPIEPLAPEDFSPYASDSESMMRGINQILSRAQINDLQRKRAYGVLGRTRNGLHPSGRAPYGYSLKDKTLVINPAEAATLTDIKDWYLNGWGVPQIIRTLKAKRIPAPGGRGWSDYGIRYILRNPIYAGIVGLGYTRKTSDPRTGKRKQIPGDPAKVVEEKGNHQALWDTTTRQQILDTMKRRAMKHKGPLKTQRLSSLLYCPKHKRGLWVFYAHNQHDDENRFWYCPAEGPHWHLCVKDKDVLAQVIAALVKQVKARKRPLPRPPEDSRLYVRARDDLLARRERLTDALEQGRLDPVTYADRVERLDEQLRAVEEKLSEASRYAERERARNDNLSRMKRIIEGMPDALRRSDPQQVNAILRAAIERIEVSGNGLTMRFR
jgi:hypothetical protein